MIEKTILQNFPSSHQASLRVALYEIAWAFENIDHLESLIGPVYNRIVRSGTIESFDGAIIMGMLNEAGELLAHAASQLEDARLRLDIATLDRKAEAR